jgi:hypothetical protein
MKQASVRTKLPWDSGSIRLFSVQFMLNSLSQSNAILRSCKLLFSSKILAVVESFNCKSFVIVSFQRQGALPEFYP